MKVEVVVVVITLITLLVAAVVGMMMDYNVDANGMCHCAPGVISQMADRLVLITNVAWECVPEGVELASLQHVTKSLVTIIYHLA